VSGAFDHLDIHLPLQITGFATGRLRGAAGRRDRDRVAAAECDRAGAPLPLVRREGRQAYAGDRSARRVGTLVPSGHPADRAPRVGRHRPD
jgi:hypothetical protein